MATRPPRNAVDAHAQVPLLRARIDPEHRDQAARARGERRVGGDPADALEVERRERRARVEPVPAEPQDHTADGRDRQVVRGEGSPTVPLEPAAEPRAQDDRACERDEPTDGVHHGRAREVAEHGPAREAVEEAGCHVAEPAARTPHPVTEDRVDEPGDADRVEQVALESRATDHGARRDRGARVGERELEQPERQERHAGRAVGGRRAVQEEVLRADQAVAFAEHEREPERPEQEAAQERVDDAFGEDVHGLARPGEACFQRHEPGLHEEDEERGDQHPDGVDGVHQVVRLVRHLLRRRGRVDQPDDLVDREQHRDHAEHLAGEDRDDQLPCAAVGQTATECLHHRSLPLPRSIGAFDGTRLRSPVSVGSRSFEAMYRA